VLWIISPRIFLHILVLSLRSLEFILKISSLIPKPFFKKPHQTEMTLPRNSVSQVATTATSKEVYPLGAPGLPPLSLPISMFTSKTLEKITLPRLLRQRQEPTNTKLSFLLKIHATKCLLTSKGNQTNNGRR